MGQSQDTISSHLTLSVTGSVIRVFYDHPQGEYWFEARVIAREAHGDEVWQVGLDCGSGMSVRHISRMKLSADAPLTWHFDSRYTVTRIERVD
jgi:hypothetical protein